MRIEHGFLEESMTLAARYSFLYQITRRYSFTTCKPVVRRNCDKISEFGSLRCRSRTPQKVGERGTRQRAAKQEQRRQELDRYRSRFGRALEAEHTQEMAALKERLKNWPKKRLKEEGLALFDLSVRLDGQLYRDTVLQFHNMHEDGLLPTHHQFTQGDVITISRRDPLEEGDSVIEGVVMERARRFLKVAIPATQAGDIDQRLKWRLDLWGNRVAYERCMWAINTFASPQIRRGYTRWLDTATSSIKSAEPFSSGSAPDSMPTMGEGVMSFRDMIIEAESVQIRMKESKSFPIAGNKTAQFMRVEQSPKSSLTTDSLRVVSTPPSRVSGKHIGPYKNLVATFLREMGVDINSSQKTAIQNAMCHRMTLWQGPPGTGKTRTLVRFIKVFCKHGAGQVLACADSNVAVDNLVEGLLEQGLRVARVGQPVKVKEELRDSTVAAQVAAHPLMKRARQYREDAISKRKAVRQINNDKKRKSGAIEATGLWEKALELEREAVKAVLDGADVIAATCVGAGDPILDDRQFGACVIDEATQATEPATLIPILRSGADMVVLVGDPAQLPPTVVSQDALQDGLSKSLFEHLQECGLEPFLLNTQYRMHPFLASWPSAIFYGSRLLSEVMPAERPIPRGLEWPNKEKPLAFIDCANSLEQTTALGNSWFNRGEALQVVRAVKRLINHIDMDVRCSDIGVISPYSAQVRLLQDMFMDSEGADRGKLTDVEVKTVDGFQGREKEVIVISTVRSNSERRLGFVTDPRRMNVALTRARRAVVVVGDSRTLQSNYHWDQWLDMIRKEEISLIM